MARRSRIEIEIDDTDDDVGGSDAPGGAERAAAGDKAEPDVTDLSPDDRREYLMSAARKLTATDDPTALSYVLTALIQVDLAARQELLEAPDTTQRLARLDALLVRETWFLKQGLRPIIIGTQSVPGRRS